MPPSVLVQFHKDGICVKFRTPGGVHGQMMEAKDRFVAVFQQDNSLAHTTTVAILVIERSDT
jgi:hypothetical protein